MLSFGYGVKHRLDCLLRLGGGGGTTTTPFMIFSVTYTIWERPKLDA